MEKYDVMERLFAEAQMKRLPTERVGYIAQRKFEGWIAEYGLKDAIRIQRELGRKLRAETNRRKLLEEKK